MCVVNRCRIFAKHPIKVPVRLEKFDKGFHGYLHHVSATCALQGKKKMWPWTTVNMFSNFHIKFQYLWFSLILHTHDFTWKVKHYLWGHFSIIYPAQSGKVCRFCTVETMIEASMVAIREGNHELTSFLSNLRMEKNRGGNCFKEIWVTGILYSYFQKNFKKAELKRNRTIKISYWRFLKKGQF